MCQKILKDKKNQTLLNVSDKKSICGLIAHFPSTTDTLKRNNMTTLFGKKWCKTNLKRSSSHKREDICSPITQNFWWKSEFSGKLLHGASLLPIILPPVLATGFSPYTIQQPFPAISQQLIFKKDMVFQMFFFQIFLKMFFQIFFPRFLQQVSPIHHPTTLPSY